MRQEVTCVRCKHVSTTFQHFMDILVDIQQSNTIEEALAGFFRQRKLGYPGDEASLYKCEKCKVKVQAKWQCFLEKPPAVLCVQLKRFTLLGGKIGKPIQLSRKLNIGSFLKHPGKTEVTYALRSMITHVGPSPNCGHYTAIGEASNGQFYQFDDASVRQISINQVLRTASYVVFYEMLPSSWSNQLGPNQVQHVPTAPPAPAMIPRQVQPSPQMKPRPPQIINKLGIVSKNIFTNIIDSAKKGLVPYDDNDTDDEDQQEIVPKTVKKVIEKPLKAISATARNWTVTDVSSENHENPSVHSDNSTGSTSNSWKVTANNGARPASAMSGESDSTKSSSKWTVTTLKKAIEQDSDENHKNCESGSSGGTSTPSSSGSGTSVGSSTANSLSSRKRPSIDIDEVDDYDAELDRGRVKKVKTLMKSHSDSTSSGIENPFQKQQDYQNRSRTEYRSHSQGRWDHGKSRFYHDQYRDRDRYNNHGGGGGSYNGGRRKSFGSFKDSKYNRDHHHKRYSHHHHGGSSGSHHHHHHESNHYRDNFHRRSSR